MLDASPIHGWSRRWFAAWSAHDADAIAALCTEDVVWNDPALPAPARGRDGVRDFTTATFTAFPDFRLEQVEPPYLSGWEPVALSQVECGGTMTGPWEPLRMAATGRSFAVRGVDRWEFRDGLLGRYDTFYDTLDMARQLGFMPQRSSWRDRLLARLQDAVGPLRQPSGWISAAVERREGAPCRLARAVRSR